MGLSAQQPTAELEKILAAPSDSRSAPAEAARPEPVDRKKLEQVGKLAKSEDAAPYLAGESPEMEQPGLRVRTPPPRYRLRSGDVLDLTFPFLPQFTQQLTVLPDGYVNLRGISDLWVEGMTVPEVDEALRTAYGKILKDPVFNLVLRDFEKPYFIAFGQVQKPGKYDLRGRTTVTQALGIAGGFGPGAKHSQVLLMRNVSNGWVRVKNLNVSKMMAKADLSEDLYLEPGDMLFVPTTLISKVKDFIPRLNWGLGY